MNTLQRWMRAATPEEKQQLAGLAGTTVGTLKQVAGAYRTKGKLSVSPELAANIALGTFTLYRKGLHLVSVEQLSPTCAGCSFLKRCRAQEKKNG